MATKILKISTYIVVVVLITIAVYAVSVHQIDFSGTTTEPTSTEINNVTMKIFSDSWSIIHIYESTRNITVFDLLNQTAYLYNFTVTKTYFAGHDSFFVSSINNIVNGENNYYWQYYVNGEYADKGCSNYFLSDNDIVEWNFNKSPY